MVTNLMALDLAVCGRSHVGKVRAKNEDVWAEESDIGFFALADGMGGRQAGDIASRQAINELCSLVREFAHPEREGVGSHDFMQFLRQAIEQVNTHVRDLGQSDASLEGMGTTLDCMKFFDTEVVIGHVGDSRIYRLRGGKLVQITKDHSLVRELIDLGNIPESEESQFMYRHVITQAIGTSATVDPNVVTFDVQTGDLYLMCSDGLSDLHERAEIEELMSLDASLEERADRLVASSNNKGGKDNVTVVLVEVRNGRHSDLS